MHTNDVYEICVDGCLGNVWQAWFDQVELLAAGDDLKRTILVVPAADPATLFGILAQIGALNLRLISVERRPAHRN